MFCDLEGAAIDGVARCSKGCRGYLALPRIFIQEAFLIMSI